MANIYEIASYLEAGLTVIGYDVERRIGFTPDHIFICAESTGRRHASIMVSNRLTYDVFNSDQFYFVTSLEDADRFIRDFNSVNS